MQFDQRENLRNVDIRAAGVASLREIAALRADTAGLHASPEEARQRANVGRAVWGNSKGGMRASGLGRSFGIRRQSGLGRSIWTGWKGVRPSAPPSSLFAAFSVLPTIVVSRASPEIAGVPRPLARPSSKPSNAALGNLPTHSAAPTVTLFG